MKRTDILIPVYASSNHHYCLFRLCVESIFQRIPRDHYEDIVIVDDHSPNPLFIKYTDHLAASGKAKVIRNGEPRNSFYSPNGAAATSKGHGESLNIGIQAVSSDYALIMDPDCLVLKGSLMEECLKAFDLDAKVMAAGQLTGEFQGLTVVDRADKKALDTSKKMSYRGVINACLVIVKMEAWTRHNLKRFDNSGWAHGPFAFDIYDRGFKCCNFDFFLENYAVHFGGGVLKQIRYQEGDVRFLFGSDLQAKDYERKKSRNESYAGNPKLFINTHDFRKAIMDAYLDLDFDQHGQLPTLSGKSEYATLEFQ